MNYFSSISTTRKIVSFIFFGIFTWSAFVQLNDPDPFHWFAIYFIVALIHVVGLFKQLSRSFIWIVVIALLSYSFYHFSYFMDWIEIENKNELFGEMIYEKPYLEGTREFLGLLICAISLLYPLKKSSK